MTQKQLHLGLYSTLAEFSEGQAKGKLVVVIDVLRAASTIVQACENQVERIIPVAGVEDASKLVPTLERKKTLLGGESEGRKIEGFDLGNSPLEYTRELVKGKTLILSTTNGTVAITRSSPADEIVVGCFLNLGAVVAHLASSGADSVALLCSGNLGQLALEDFLCGGLVVERLAGNRGLALDLNDGAVAARALAQSTLDVGEAVRNSSHARYLAGLGFGDDIGFCSKLDEYETVPVVADGRISRQKPARR